MVKRSIIKRSAFLLFTLFISFTSSTALFAQRSPGSILSEARKKKAKLDYPQAIKLYKQALNIEKDHPKALEGLIDIYLYRYEIYDSAEVYILKRIHAPADTNERVFFDYANCLRMQERQYEAIDQYLYFKKNGLKKKKFAYLEQEVNDHLATCRFAIKNKSIVNDNNTFTIENMDFFINSVDSEYTPVFIEEDNLLLYNARYKDFEEEEVTSDNKYYENIYYFDLSESVASSYNPGIKQDNHHAVIGRRSDNNDILIFHKNKIWSSSIDEDRLNKITALPAVLDRYYFQPHGVFSNDGNTFIFSAMDRPEIEGGDLNIYISTQQEDSSWTPPKLISPVINSEKDDDSPFLSSDGKTLYFSSKGHNSSGGYDFYKSELKNGKWTTPENLGYPMNSAGDDIYLSFTEDDKRGFFSSNRDGGFGLMDIYSFTVDQKTIEGVIYDKKGVPLADVIVTLTNLETGEELYESSDENGLFSFQADSDQEFKLLGEKENYFNGANAVNTMTTERTVKTDITLEKDPGISIYAIVTDKKTGDVVDSVKMTITDNMTGTSENYLTPVTGDYRRTLADKKLNDRGSYNFTFEKEGHLTKTITYNILFDKEGVYNLHKDMDISLDKLAVGEDLSKVVDINPIYFDMNKSNIRPDAAIELDKIITVMNENPNMVVELRSHTDSRGSATSNASLSERRAQSSANYIKERITTPGRITGKGYGETRLVNECADGVKCSNEKHQENRRTEFIIVQL